MLLHVCQQMIGYTDILTEADKAMTATTASAWPAVSKR